MANSFADVEGVPAVVKHHRRMNPVMRREMVAAYLFILPTILGFAVFIAGPLISAIVLSLFDWDILQPAKFVGLGNYKRLLLVDSRILVVYKNTLVFTLGAVLLNLTFALLLALAINRKINAVLRYFFRTTYFFPVITSLASVSIVWQFLLNTDLGPINYYLARWGLPRIPWTTSSRWAMRSVIFLDVWKNVGFNMVLFIAGLQNIPRQLYEAAEVDGANAFQKFRSITLPMLSPTMFFALVIALIGALQIFDSPFIITQGGPGDASRTVVMYIYENGFRFFKMGYASTVAMSLFVVILILTMIQFRLGKVWVFYQ
ncbi:MAG: carbohydrate ABC transporter permease [bacterium]